MALSLFRSQIALCLSHCVVYYVTIFATLPAMPSMMKTKRLLQDLRVVQDRLVEAGLLHGGLLVGRRVGHRRGQHGDARHVVDHCDQLRSC